jgi:RNA polymerase sigma-70 factor (ECF subfamily)
VTCLSTAAAQLSKPPCLRQGKNQPRLFAVAVRDDKRPSGGTAGIGRGNLRGTRSEKQKLETLEEMLLRSRAKFVGIAYAILRNKEDAEDAIQNASLSAFSHLRSFEGRSSFTTWFTRIVMNSALMIQRRRKSTLTGPLPEPTAENVSWADKIPSSQPDPEMVCAEEETFQLIDVVLGRMSPVLRQAFTMIYYDEMSSREACALLGVSVGTFKSRVFRARRLLLGHIRNVAAYPIRKGTSRAFFSAARCDFQPLTTGAKDISSLEVPLS